MQDLVDPASPVDRLGDPRHLPEQDAKFVPAETGELGAADEVAQPRRQLLEQHVAPLVPQGVVDLPEPIEIDEQHGDSAATIGRLAQRLADHEGELEPVGEVRQGVVEGLMLLLSDLPAQPVDQPTPLERNAGLTSEDVQDAPLVRGERTAGTPPGHHDHRRRAGPASEQGDHAIFDVAIPVVRRDRRWSVAERSHDAARHGRLGDRLGDRRRGRTAADPLTVPQRGDRRADATRHHHLDQVCVEQLARVGERRLDQIVGLDRLVHRAGERVDGFEVLEALVERPVDPQRSVHRRGDHHDTDESQGLAPRHGERSHRQAGGHEGDHCSCYQGSCDCAHGATGLVDRDRHRHHGCSDDHRHRQGEEPCSEACDGNR